MRTAAHLVLSGGRFFPVFRIGARRCVALDKQVEGLHKASGLDLRQHHGAQVGDLVRPGESEQEPNRASKRANSFSIK